MKKAYIASFLGLVVAVLGTTSGAKAAVTTTIPGDIKLLQWGASIGFNNGTQSAILDNGNLTIQTDDILVIDAKIKTVLNGDLDLDKWGASLNFHSVGGSSLYDTGDLTLETDDFIDLVAPAAVVVSNDLQVNGDFTVGGSFVTDSFVGDLTGDVTGNLTGNVSGDVTGNVTGNADSATVANGLSAGALTNAMVSNTAAIAYSKLNIANADLTIAKTSGLQAALDAKLALGGGTMTGAINMGTNNISNAGTIAATSFTGDLTGDVTGDVTGNVTGNLTGDVTGDVTGNVTGNLTGDVTGDVTGNVTGNLTGDVTGDVTGNLTGNVTGNVTGDLTGNADSATIADTLSAGALTNAMVSDTAAIVYSKLSISDADLTIAKTNGLQAALDAKLALGGGTMTGSIDLGTNDISNGGTVTATSFVGALTGNATTATTAGALSAGSLTTAMIGAGVVTADKLQSAGADLGAATININLSNTNGSYVTNLTIDGTLTAPTVIGNLTGNVTGNLFGNITGNLVGNVTGNLTGDVTGDLTGNADTATSATTATYVPKGVGEGSTCAVPSDAGKMYYATTTVGSMNSGRVYVCVDDADGNGTDDDYAWEALN